MIGPPRDRDLPPDAGRAPEDAATRIVPPEAGVADVPPEPGYRRVERTVDPLADEVVALGDEVRRLRLSLIGALVLAATAIVFAVFALIRQEERRPESSRLAGLEERLDEQRARDEALRERLARLDDRIDRVSRARSEGSDRLQEIERTVDRLGDGQTTLDRRLRQAEAEAGRRDTGLDDLSRRLDELEQLPPG